MPFNAARANAKAQAIADAFVPVGAGDAREEETRFIVIGTYYVRVGCWSSAITGYLVEVEVNVRRRSFAGVTHGPGRRKTFPRMIGAALRLTTRCSVG